MIMAWVEPCPVVLREIEKNVVLSRAQKDTFSAVQNNCTPNKKLFNVKSQYDSLVFGYVSCTHEIETYNLVTKFRKNTSTHILLCMSSWA
jgi:hypothetical protein